MKTKKVLPAFILLLVTVVFTQGATHIVDSRYPRPTGVHATIQLAYNAASAGDTILILPATGEYAGITLTKCVHIVGTGWSDGSTSVPHTKTSGFTFNAGSQGSSISGLELNGGFDINTDSITVKRNKLHSIYVRANSTNIVISQNFISSGRVDCCTWYNNAIIVIWENTEVFISNNIINNTYFGSYGQYGIGVFYPSNVFIANNVIKVEDYALNLSMSGGNYMTQSVYNNIVLAGALSGVTGSNHNIGNTTQFPLTDGNQQNVSMTAVFVDATNHNYHLKAGSPAIGAGLDGTDCGLYGGLYPFVDNGRSWLPMITEIDVPNTVNVNEGMDVNVKAKSGK